MIWIILAIIVVGYFIVAAINRSTQTNAVIAQQQYLNSPEYKKQEQATLAYFSHLGDVLDGQVRIAEHKVQLLEPPKQLVVWAFPKTGKSLAKYETITDQKDIKKALKKDIEDDEQLIRNLTKDYQEKKKDYAGYEPEDLETAKTKYGLNESFVGEDWIEEEGSWGMFQKKRQELDRLNKELARLKSVDATIRSKSLAKI